MGKFRASTLVHPTIWGGIRRWPAASRRRIARTALLLSVALAVLPGLVLALIMTWAIGGAVGREVRQTIVRIISAHLQPEAPILVWPRLRLHRRAVRRCLVRQGDVQRRDHPVQRATFAARPSGSTRRRSAARTPRSAGRRSAANLLRLNPHAREIHVAFDYPSGGDLPESIHPREWPPQEWPPQVDS